MCQLLCLLETGLIAQWCAVIPKMQQLDSHAVPTTPIPEGPWNIRNTQLSSELISAIVLDYFLSQKNLQKLCQDYRLPPATSNAVFPDWQTCVIPEALKADNSSHIAILLHVFVSFWQGGSGGREVETGKRCCVQLWTWLLTSFCPVATQASQASKQCWQQNAIFKDYKLVDGPFSGRGSLMVTEQGNALIHYVV